MKSLSACLFLFLTPPDSFYRNKKYTVFVVADEVAVGIGGEGSLSRARQAEEQGRVALLSLVSRAVHGHDSIQRQPVVHHREDSLLHLSPVPVVPNEYPKKQGKTKEEK